MSFDLSGLDSKLESQTIVISVPSTHRLIKLANLLPMEEITETILPDLKCSTAKGCWWTGRPTRVRIHLGIHFLQIIYDLKDREAIERLTYDGSFQVFCGHGSVDVWQIPCFTKVEEFRNRLSPDTRRSIVNIVAKCAVEAGFASPAHLDVDSTVQEANMSYSADGNLLVKLGRKVGRVFGWLKEKFDVPVPEEVSTGLKELGQKAKGYFFASRKNDEKRQGLEALHAHVKKTVYTGLDHFKNLDSTVVESMPWNIRHHFNHVTELGKRYVLDVAHYIRKGTLKTGKILSFHLNEVAYINKGKTGKGGQFGREFQIGRLEGNIVIACENNSVRTNDKVAMQPMRDVHASLFGEDALKSVAGDRGYYSNANKKALSDLDEYHLGYQWEGESEEDVHRLRGRRAGIEPIIGHIKQGGQLGRSRMKSDKATYAAGYGAMAGFNLRQMLRRL